MPFPIDRKVLVPSDIQMDELHLVIQVAMGWENAHLYQFNNNLDVLWNAWIDEEGDE